MDQDQSAIPLLATIPTRRADRRAALFIVISLFFGGILCVRYAGVAWPMIPAFVPASDAGIVLLNMITAMLLIGQFRQIGAPSLLVLGCGYLSGAALDAAHLLAFPGTITAPSLLKATDQSALWLFMFWQGSFALFVLTFAILTQSRFDRPIRQERLGLTITLGIVLTLVIVALCILQATIGSIFMPTIVRNDNFASIRTDLFGVFMEVTCALALGILFFRTRGRQVLSLWICVMLLISLFQAVIATESNQVRFDVGWYIARIYNLLSACIVLSTLLIETGGLYGRLTKLIAETGAQSLQLSKSEAALRQAQKMEAIGQMTGGIAHDFNNLLTVIISSLDMLKRDPAHTSRLAEQGLAAATKAAQLTRQLLTFSRHQITRPERVDINQLIRTFDGTVRQALGGTIETRLDLGDDINHVHVDVAEFKAAILNIAFNARDAMNGIGAIAIETRNILVDGECAALNPEVAIGDYVMVAFSDTGVGMDEDTMSHAFEPFFTTKHIGKGSGLGLSQVYGFIKNADGHVRVESAVGMGARISLYFPRACGAVSPVDEAPILQPIQTAGLQTVLIVEDDPEVMEIVTESLGRLGYAVMTAYNAEQALEQVATGEKIDIVFSDIVMPGMNGIELARELRRLYPTLKILLTSGYIASTLTSENPMPSGVQLITKPYRLEQLRQKLKEVIEGVV